MKKRMNISYESPTIEVFEIHSEQGFAQSGESDPNGVGTYTSPWSTGETDWLN